MENKNKKIIVIIIILVVLLISSFFVYKYYLSNKKIPTLTVEQQQQMLLKSLGSTSVKIPTVAEQKTVLNALSSVKNKKTLTDTQKQQLIDALSRK